MPRPLAVLFSFGLLIGVNSIAADGSSGPLLKFPVGATFAAGAFDVHNALKSSLEDNGYSISRDFVWPVGISLNPRLEFPCGFGAGLTAGPTDFVAIRYNNSGNRTTDFNYIVPVGGFLQYNFLRDTPVSPYLRVGAKYPITGGDSFHSGEASAFGAAGVEFLRNKRIGLGAEFGYDASEIKIRSGPAGPDRRVRPTGFNASIFIVF